MRKKFLKIILLLLICLNAPSYAEEQKFSAGILYEKNVDFENCKEFLPKIENDYVDFNYNADFKTLDILSTDEVKIIKPNKGFTFLTNDQTEIPKNYEISFDTGKIKGNYKTSVEIESLLRKNPKDTNLIFNYAVQLKKENDLEKALFAVNKFIEIEPDSALGHFLKGDILRKMEKFKESVDEYIYTTQINPYCADAYFNIAKILELLDNRELALDYYKIAYQINPNDKEIQEIILNNPE